MKKVLIAGTGKIGSLIAHLLANTAGYEVHIIDMQFDTPDIQRVLQQTPTIHAQQLDIQQCQPIVEYLKTNQIIAVISSLPFSLTYAMAKAAHFANTHYFDLTEDTQVSLNIAKLAEHTSKAFVSHCGLAPGFIGIVANNLIQQLDTDICAELRVGALPQCMNTALQYALTWSTAGLINEYGNPCAAIAAGKTILLQPLTDLETLELNGSSYEAFNTAGGLGHLLQVVQDKVQTLNYKTIRYPGHCEKMRFLMYELQLNNDRQTLQTILERVIPKTYQDIVIVYVRVYGMQQGQLLDKHYLKYIYPQTAYGLSWSAIQISTAYSLCAVVDLILNDSTTYHGFVMPETIALDTFLNNQFGKIFN